MTTGLVTTIPTYINTLFGSTYIKGAGVDVPNNFLQIDIWPAGTRLASHNNVIVLYNTQTNTFNDLQVGNVYNYSDARAKANAQELKYGLTTLNSLKPASYKFIKASENERKGNKTEIGLLAQDVEKIIPKVVITDADGKKLINYTSLIPVLIKSIQELKAEVEALKSKK